jgi:hypothetical protein
MKRRPARSYLDGLGTFDSVFERHALAVQEAVESFDPEREDPLVNPWRRGHKTGLRSLLGR